VPADAVKKDAAKKKTDVPSKKKHQGSDLLPPHS
jgi:hypothetical protein